MATMTTKAVGQLAMIIGDALPLEIRDVQRELANRELEVEVYPEREPAVTQRQQHREDCVHPPVIREEHSEPQPKCIDDNQHKDNF